MQNPQKLSTPLLFVFLLLPWIVPFLSILPTQWSEIGSENKKNIQQLAWRVQKLERRMASLEYRLQLREQEEERTQTKTKLPNHIQQLETRMAELEIYMADRQREEGDEPKHPPLPNGYNVLKHIGFTHP